MAEDIEFVNGLIVKAPHEKAPDFVKAAISIRPRELAEWLADKMHQDLVNVDVKESKGGKWYAAVNTYKPKEGKPDPAHKQKPANFDDDFDGLPF